jgi:DNA-binding transcriptional LysR family regulator
MDVHLRDLRAFVVVANELHFSRAAQILFVSQPALSKQIRGLEDRLGTKLFDRGGNHREVSLTDAGRTLLPFAEQAVATWNQGLRAVDEVVRHQAEQLVVNLTVSLGRGLLPMVRQVFGERRPKWRLELRQVTFDVGLRDLCDGVADVAFSWLPVAERGLRWQVLLTEPRLVALPVNHRLADQDEVVFEDLLDEPFLALPETAGSKRSYWLAEEARGGRPARIGAVVHGPEDTLEALAQGVGIAFISSGNAALFQRPTFVCRPVPGLSPAHLAVVWRGTDQRRVVQDFVTSCAEASARLPTLTA